MLTQPTPGLCRHCGNNPGIPKKGRLCHACYAYRLRNGQLPDQFTLEARAEQQHHARSEPAGFMTTRAGKIGTRALRGGGRRR